MARRSIGSQAWPCPTCGDVRAFVQPPCSDGHTEDGGRTAPPRISWHDGEASGTATGIVEVRAADRAGLLYRLTTAITGEGLDVTSALIETLGADAVDCFYVCNPSGSPVEPEQRRRVDDALVSATLGAGAGERARADTPGRFR